ncbi:hypothetical protein ACNPKZ_05220 [Shewanella algae]|jgi:type II secretory pathway component PulK|uniref:Uncharacterized protein n=1 Tax=Shewanella chilikensis TaxID=558541 RepID=A0A6G7LND9_9GAMM|nr:MULTISPECIES: hypothetical protein [Shewanella]MBO2677828.1 hypothetical protein [Shewanella algae]MBZ4678092.1 hypothetical protein [Shewanella sp.]MCE9852363.1 hypothetical protein [Shewanella chilikensis]MCL1153791.1 hypothetical protein [Shewanella chilikensis]PYE58852.1 hypothetical protein C8J23_11152 [Shewanella chilikensis]
MKTSNLTIQSLLLGVVLASASVSAQADVLPTQPILSAVEQNLSQQAQTMLLSAKREMLASLQQELERSVAQLSDEMTQETLSQITELPVETSVLTQAKD